MGSKPHPVSGYQVFDEIVPGYTLASIISGESRGIIPLNFFSDLEERTRGPVNSHYSIKDQDVDPEDYNTRELWLFLAHEGLDVRNFHSLSINLENI